MFLGADALILLIEDSHDSPLLFVHFPICIN